MKVGDNFASVVGRSLLELGGNNAIIGIYFILSTIDLSTNDDFLDGCLSFSKLFYFLSVFQKLDICKASLENLAYDVSKLFNLRGY